MPIYEYTCQVCNTTFEHWHPSMKEQVVPACPACGNVDVQRKISAPAVHTGAQSTAESTAETTPAKPEVFGRKELNASLAARGLKPEKR